MEAAVVLPRVFPMCTTLKKALRDESVLHALQRWDGLCLQQCMCV